MYTTRVRSEIDVHKTFHSEQNPSCWKRVTDCFQNIRGYLDPREWSSGAQIKTIAATSIVVDFLTISLAAGLIQGFEETRGKLSGVDCGSQALCEDEVRIWNKGTKEWQNLLGGAIACSCVSAVAGVYSLARSCFRGANEWGDHLGSAFVTLGSSGISWVVIVTTSVKYFLTEARDLQSPAIRSVLAEESFKDEIVALLSSSTPKGIVGAILLICLLRLN